MIRKREHLRLWRSPNFVGALVAMFFVVLTVWVIFALQGQATSEIRQQNQRLEVAYAQLRDQDLTLNIFPATPPLGQVLNPEVKAQGAFLPRSFTVAFPPYGYDTCTDRTGDSSYVCSFTRTKNSPPLPGQTTTTTRP